MFGFGRESERIDSLVNVLRNRFGRDITVEEKPADSSADGSELAQALNEEAEMLNELAVSTEGNGDIERPEDLLAPFLRLQNQTDEICRKMKARISNK